MDNLLRKLIIIFIMINFNCYATNYVGKISQIPDYVKQKMIGHTWHDGCPVGLDELVYLQLPYWGFDNKPHYGEMIIHEVVAKEVVDIFGKLYKAHFPIERMVLPEEIEQTHLPDNTYGFNCRVDGQSPQNYSPHSFGLAIDINQAYNPAIDYGGKVDPRGSDKYLNRELTVKGMIKEGDLVTTLFYAHGWKWGAYFKNGVDYQHFQKMMSSTYTANSISHRIKNERPKLPAYY